MRQQLIKTFYAYCGFLLLVSTSTIIESCDPIDCNVTPIQFELVSFSADWVRIVGEGPLNSQVDTFQIESYQPTSQGIRFDSLAIRTVNVIEGISLNRDANANWGFNSLMACSPATTYDALEDIEIISDADYDADHPAGSNLNDLISIRRVNFKEGLLIPAVIIGFEVDNQDLLLTFDQGPVESLSHKLSITYVMLDGRRLSQNLAEVIIRP